MSQGINETLSKCVDLVNDFIKSVLQGKPESLYDASYYYLKSGGKRLRPFMTLKSCEMFGGDYNNALPGAVAVELIHNFSLVHDDIMDNDETRHNVKTVHKQYGTPSAILAGDVLFSKAFQLLSINYSQIGIDYGYITQMIAKLSNACIYVCEGQALDIAMASNSIIPSYSDYLNMISKKTAALFDVACAIGVLSSKNVAEEDVINLSSFGKNIGIAFQLIDDLIGIVGNSKLTGKAVGNDLREGKKTFPILLALNSSDKEQQIKILRVFGVKNSSQEFIESAVDVIRELKIEKEVRDVAGRYMKNALDSLNKYPSSNAKDSLVNIAKFVVERST